MENFGLQVKAPQNYEQKCCCILVVDVSGSMDGEKINQLNNGLRDFHAEILADTNTCQKLEVGLIEFHNEINVLVEPALVTTFQMPTLVTKGTTKMVDAVRKGIELVRTQKSWYKSTGQPYFRPWIVLITDGEPDAGQDVWGLQNEIHEGTNNKEFSFLAIGVAGANMNLLASISAPNMPPAPLEGAKFVEFFQWLSASMTIVANSKEGGTVNLPAPNSWMTGYKV
ncbi:MAG: VWA domain-containing protein [Chitinophagia bacterium]|nr:VWA domain-containing protein [Chitinophagia bacterium]